MEKEIVESYSWTKVNNNYAYKVLDKSAFLHNGTAIPQGIKPFFLEQPMVHGERRIISLEYKSRIYAAYINFKLSDSTRIYLYWNVEFASVIKSTFPYHYQLFNNHQQFETGIIIQFRRMKDFNHYQVSFSYIVENETLNNDVQADIVENIEPRMEGAIKNYYGKRYERSPINRKIAIDLHGVICNVCGFNFGETYGARGVDFIEVHHVKPISSFTEEQSIDPKTDLITVCSNCHRMIHRQPDNILTPEQLKEILLTNRRG